MYTYCNLLAIYFIIIQHKEYLGLALKSQMTFKKIIYISTSNKNQKKETNISLYGTYF